MDPLNYGRQGNNGYYTPDRFLVPALPDYLLEEGEREEDSIEGEQPDVATVFENDDDSNSENTYRSLHIITCHYRSSQIITDHNNAQNSFTSFYDFYKFLLKSIKTNHVLYKLSITKPTKINQVTYKNPNNKLNSIKRKAERDHYRNQLEINTSDMKKSWKIMKTVIGNKRKTIKKKALFNINNKTIDSELLQIANEFNNYFVSIGLKLASYQTRTTLNPLNSLQFNANSVVIDHIEEIEVVRIINSLIWI